MIRSRLYLLGTTLLTSLFLALLFMNTPAHAAGEMYIWDGNDLMAIKGEYTKPVKFVLREGKYYSPAMDIPINNDKRASCSNLPKGEVSLAVETGVEIGGGNEADSSKKVIKWEDSDQSTLNQSATGRNCFVSLYGGTSAWNNFGNALFDLNTNNGIQDKKDLNFSQFSQLSGEKGKSFKDNCERIPSIEQQCEEIAQEAAAANGGSEDQTETQCAVDGIGWIVCPVLLFFAKATDGIYGLVEGFLKVQPLSMDITGGNQPPQYVLWANLRNFANIAFIMAFLVIIFSQVTGKGFNNYNVKKLLPRLIVAAVLMNASYIICAVAVDISNIVGANLKDLIEGANKGSAPGMIAQDDGKVATGLAAAGVTTGLVMTALAGKAAIALVSPQLMVYALVGFVLPMLLAGFLAIITVLVILAARQAIIILLVAISPLAFVAFLLPNTMKWYQKWQKLFIVMLVMYPMIALIFAASKVASEIVVATGDGWMEKFFGVGIAMIPLFIVPVIMKSGGGVLDRFGLWSKGMAKRSPLSKWGKSRFGEEWKRPGSNMRKFEFGKGIEDGSVYSGKIGRRILGGTGSRRRRIFGDAASGRQLRDMERRRQDALNSRELLGAQSEHFTGDGGLDRVASTPADQALVMASLDAEAKKAFDELASAFMHKDETMGLDKWQDILRSDTSSAEEKAAVASLIAKSNDAANNNLAWESVKATGNEEIIKTYVDELTRNKPEWLSQGQLASMREQGGSGRSSSLQDMAASTVASGALSSADRQAGMHPDDLSFAYEAAYAKAASGSISTDERHHYQEGLDGMTGAAQKALSDNRINVKIGKNRNVIEQIASQPLMRPGRRQPPSGSGGSYTI